MTPRVLLLGLLLATAAALPVHAQANDGPPDFAEMRQRAMDRMNETIGANPEEWHAMRPKIEKIQQLQRDIAPRSMDMGGPGPGGGGRPQEGGSAGPYGGFGGPGGPPPGFDVPDSGTPSEVQQKLRELRNALRDKDTPADDLKAKTDACRQARAKAKDDLKAAQDDLQQSVTNPHEEAALLTMGILE